jgi:hypothetical protein
MPLDLYVFPSATQKNIEIGIENRTWAIAKPPSVRRQRQYETKARKMPVGAHGIFYCKKWFTAPFIVASPPNPCVTESSLWKGEFFLPFHIHPLSEGWPWMSTTDIRRSLPSLASVNGNWTERILVRPNLTFIPSKVTNRDWEILVQTLASIE